MRQAHIQALATHLPERVVSNGELQRENPDWDVARIAAKTGIDSRHVVAEGETAADLALAAGGKLLRGAGIDPASIDLLIFCTQSPDHPLPASACLLQYRLGLSTTCGAFDFNQGCSGYVYGLALARSWIVSGMGQRVLLLTGETYSRYVHPRDRSVRVLFGDGASATLVGAAPPGPRLEDFVLGTDGSGYQNLIVPAGGARQRPRPDADAAVTDAAGTRTPQNLFMDGPELFAFTLKRVPAMVSSLLKRAQLDRSEVQWFVLHQANRFMQDHLREKLGVAPERTPIYLQDVGNTVSASLPLVLAHCAQQFQRHDRMILAGFGVGYSWGAGLVSWEPMPTLP